MMKLNKRQLATILAALRYYQNDLERDASEGTWALASDVDPEGGIHAIATDNGSFEVLTPMEIDELTEKLN